ncbi:MAG: DUF1800 family protein [Pyrinomonadaceae bacterium]
MESRKSLSFMRILTALMCVSLCAIGVLAIESDPDPNSPTPILLSEVGSTRAAAVPEGNISRVDLTKTESRAFDLNSRVTLFVTNIKLMPDEGANAFRVYGTDILGRQYRFPVVGFTSTRWRGVWAVTVQLADEIGFWPQPEARGDLLLQLTWRGLGSNKVRLGLGQTGGGPADDENARPMPYGTTLPERVIVKETDPQFNPDYVGYRWSADRKRLQEQAAFGPSAMLDSRIRRIGLRTWLNQQFEESYPSATNPYPNQVLKPGTPQSDCDGNTTVPDVPVTCNRDTYSMYQPQTWFFKEAFYSDSQLRHRVAWALAQIWVTSGVDIQQGRHIVEYHKILSNNAFGNYRNLMKQMTLHPTMGAYLSMASSTKNSPNENYARELKQLFTIGLFMLNPDGTVQCVENNPCQPGDTAVPTYDQTVVNNLTEVLTGWTYCETTALCPNRVTGAQNFIDPLLLNNNNHDLTSKTLLTYPGVTNQNVAACTGCTGTAIATYANNSMDQALDNIFYHPNVGPFVSKIMIQHMVTSDPTPAYVGRVAAIFNNNGSGVRGDMKAVVKAILLDPEARGDVKTDPNFGKLREPVQFATNLLRHFNVRSADINSQSDGYLTGASQFTGMGEIPFFSPTVFNFFPPDYVVPGTAMLGPEFAIMTTGTTIQRANFVNRLCYTSPMVAGATTNSPNGTSVDFSDLQALSAADSTGNLLVEELNRRMLHSTMSAAMKSTILTAVTAVSSTDTLGRARQAVYLVATSSQYQVQR